MKNYPIWKIIIIFIVLTFSFTFSVPTFIYDNNSKNWFLNKKINLGLDLQGGSYLLLEIDNKPVVVQKLQLKLIQNHYY